MGEHVNESQSQIAAAFSGGWGHRNVNLNTSWDVSSSMQCSPKEGSTWPGSSSSGTEIWETNAQNVSKDPNLGEQRREPWSHAPATHIGRTWGQEKDNNDGVHTPTELWYGQPLARDANTSVRGSNSAAGHQFGVQNCPAMHFSTWGSDAKESIPKSGTGVRANPLHERAFGNWSPMTGGESAQSSSWGKTTPPSVPLHQPQQQFGGNYDDGTAVWGNPVRHFPGANDPENHRGKSSR